MYMIGQNSDYKKFIENNLYYVDKTMLIEELLTKIDEVVLITRPRRFGKTLNLSMLEYYFNIKDNNEHLFKDKKIKQSIVFSKHINKYPVIFLTLKEVKGDSFDNIYSSFKTTIRKLYLNHEYLLQSDKLSSSDKKLFNQFLDKEADIGEYKESLSTLSYCLHKHYDKKVIILLDEYDSMVNSILDKDVYKNIIDLLRGLIGSAFKGNDYLEKGVLTGILRIAKEGMFSGANNIIINTILDNDFSDKFGFTEQETLQALNDFSLQNKAQDVKEYYNGYSFGNSNKVTIYNPYSINNFLYKKEIENYWVNTGSNELLENLILHSDVEIKQKIEKLIKGNEIEVDISDDIIFPRIQESKYLWTLFLFAGYLRVTNKVLADDVYRCKVRVVNREVKSIFIGIAKYYFSKIVNTSKVLQAIAEGDVETFKEQFSNLVFNTVSYYDPGNDPESVYHAFTLGALAHLNGNGYDVKSNREEGLGRYDIAITPYDKLGIGYVIEIKKSAKSDSSLEEDAAKALKQIEDKKYYTILRNTKTKILLGISFKGKECFILSKSI